MIPSSLICNTCKHLKYCEICVSGNLLKFSTLEQSKFSRQSLSVVTNIKTEVKSKNVNNFGFGTFLFQLKCIAIVLKFLTYIQYRHIRNEIQSILQGLRQSPHSSTNLKNVKKTFILINKSGTSLPTAFRRMRKVMFSLCQFTWGDGEGAPPSPTPVSPHATPTCPDQFPPCAPCPILSPSPTYPPPPLPCDIHLPLPYSPAPTHPTGSALY